MQPTYSLEPKKSSFLFQRISGALTAWLVLVGASCATVMTSSDLEPLPGAALASLLFIGLSTYGAFVAFRKERYEVYEHHIVARSGGIFSEQVTELEFGNVTLIRQRLPWIRYRFFDVGDIIVQSAGSSTEQVVFRSVRSPDWVYRMLQKKLQKNGYSMQRSELLHEEQPDGIGALVEAIGLGTGLLFGTLYAVLAAQGRMSDPNPSNQLLEDVMTGLLDGSLNLVVAGSILVGFTSMALRYLNLRNRTYQVFDDVVVYTEGFLSRSNSLIPYEAIADAKTVQTLVNQVLGLYTVTISCRGASSEILFSRLRRGKALKAQIGRLVTSAETAKREHAAAKALAIEADQTESGPSLLRHVLPPVPADQVWTSTFQPNPMRDVVSGLVLFPALPLFLVVATIAWVTAAAKHYTIGLSSVSIRKGIFNVIETEFAYDKVTGAVIRRGPFDRMMGTVTIELWSIGSIRPLVLSSVNMRDVQIDRLLRQVGIARTPPARTVPTQFTLGVWLRTSLPLFFVLSLIIVGTVITTIVDDVRGGLLVATALCVSPLPYFVYRQVWATKQLLTLHTGHAELQTGLLWRERYFASYETMKKVSITRYPWSSQGDLKIFVAGEKQTGDQPPTPLTLDVKFLESINGLADILDDIIRGARDAGNTRSALRLPPLRNVKPHLMHALTPLLIFSPLLIVVLPVALPWAILAVRRRSYALENDRVVVRSGVLFQREVSVLYDRIDSIQRKQGALGKVFGTGQVTLFTAGSSRPDLRITCAPHFEDIYRDIRERYSRLAD